MISREEAKKAMFCDWSCFVSKEEVIEALLDSNTEKITKINAIRSRVSAYNTAKDAEIDSADKMQFEKMVNTFQPYQDPGE